MFAKIYCVSVGSVNYKAAQFAQVKHKLTIRTVPEAPELRGSSQEQWPCIHGTDQSFTASAPWPDAKTRARPRVTKNSVVKSILRLWE